VRDGLQPPKGVRLERKVEHAPDLEHPEVRDGRGTETTCEAPASVVRDRLRDGPKRLQEPFSAKSRLQTRL
jgi:hypothetical protein